MIRGKESILLVEDNESIIQLVKQNLEEAGYYVTAMRDGLEALDYLKVNRDSIELVISNLTMPKISGLTLAVEIAGAGITVPLLIITGHGGEILEQIKNNPLIAEVIHKPFTRSELFRIVRRVLDKG
jgi:DNA-binding response OmpR family regulator